MILVFGKSGQVATELARLAAARETPMILLGRDIADLSAPGACAAAINARKPAAVINAAAFTAVDQAEDDEALAQTINGEAPGEMAEACARLGIPLVQISTDYVFSGTGKVPWQPGDTTGPLGAYGRSKLAGEAAIRGTGATYAILRTSWVFSAHGNNFVKTMLRLSETRDTLGVVNDQIGGPTDAASIAATCLQIAERLQSDPARSGTYHFSGAPDVSWADFAREIFAQSGKDVTVNNIATAEFKTKALRPANSRMNCDALASAFGIMRPDWRASLTLILKEIGALKP